MCYITNKLLYLLKALLSGIVPTTLVSVLNQASSTSIGAALTAAATTTTTTTESSTSTSNFITEDNVFIQGNPPTCPGSPAFKNAKCSLSITFPKSTNCAMVQSEIISRMDGVNGWIDPHNCGTYTVLNNVVNIEEKMSQITGSRMSSNGQYTDLFIFTLEEQDGRSISTDGIGSNGNGNGNGDVIASTDFTDVGCILNGCSEAQVFSILDFSTNYCNLRNLYCNKKDDGCPIVTHDFDYVETFVSCWQHDATQCITAGVAI